MKKQKWQKGQVLLITIMLLATALTVVLSSSFKSTQETQTTKLEEEAQKALAAAQAGIEAALQSGFTFVDIASLDIGFSGQATINTTTTTTFDTPLLQKDEQYTFYLSDYPNLTSYWNGSLDMYVVSESTDCPAVELTFIDSTNKVTKQLAEPCEVISGDPDIGTTNGSFNINNTTYSYKTTSSLPISNKKLVFVRLINGASKVAFEGQIDLPLQGKTIVSEAQSTTGVTKTVQLFQSYPQIPAEFFVTSF